MRAKERPISQFWFRLAGPSVLSILAACSSSSGASTERDDDPTLESADGGGSDGRLGGRDGGMTVRGDSQIAPSDDTDAASTLPDDAATPSTPSDSDAAATGPTTPGPVGEPDAGPAPTDPSLPPCQPVAAGPYYVLEGDALQVQVRCAAGQPIAAYELAFDALPSGASFDAASGMFSWTPSLSQAAVYELGIRAKASAEQVSVKIGVVDRYSDPANVPVVDEATYTEEYGLPVLHLRTDPALNDDAYTPAKVVYNGHTYTGSEAQYRGAFSMSFPKRSYTLKFTKTDKFNDVKAAGGFKNKRKITLVTPFNDNSYVRTRLSFDLWNQLDASHILVQSYSAVVFLNGVYHGLYTVVDHIDEYLMEDFGLSQEGNLYKARTHDANFRLTGEKFQPKVTLHDGYTKEEGTPEEGQPGAFDDLDTLINWVATSTPEVFRAEIDARIVRKDYEDWWLFVSFLRANDSIGKNSYHYHDPLLAGSRWRYIPWDLDESFGQNYRTTRKPAAMEPPEGGIYEDFNYLTERMLADAQLGPALRARYGQALAGPFSLAAVLSRLDAIAQEIRPSALRDEAKWGTPYRTYGNWRDRQDFRSYEEELQYVRDWITARHAYLDAIY